MLFGNKRKSYNKDPGLHGQLNVAIFFVHFDKRKISILAYLMLEINSYNKVLMKQTGKKSNI